MHFVHQNDFVTVNNIEKHLIQVKNIIYRTT